MTDRALANAEKRRDEIAAEINKLNQRIDDLRKDMASVESFIIEWHRFAGDTQDSLKGRLQDLDVDTGYPQGRMVKDTSDSPPPAPPTPKNPDKTEVGKVAKMIIYEMRRPIPRTELFRALADRGLHIHGKDPEMVLSTMLWRMKDEFVRLPGHGYWIKSLRWPAAKYEPGDIPQIDIEDVAIEKSALLGEDM